MSARVQNEGRGHRGAPGGRGGSVSPARRAAFEILRRVEEEDAFASILLANLTEELSAVDRALCYELVLGVLRWQLWLDRTLEYYARRRADELDAPVRRALRLGLYQLRFLSRIPASAAVNESVNIAHEVRLRSATGFINAVLRRATREPDHNPAEAPDIADTFERIAIKTSHPVWLIERWSAAFGVDEAEAFARSNNQMPPNAFRLNPLKSTGPSLLERLREAGDRPVPSRVAPGAWRSEGSGGALLLRTLAQEGLIYIQDEASQLVAHALEARTGERVLDACAAPGSKTTHVAAHGGARVLIVAGDRYEHRLRTVRESALRQGLRNIDLIALDAEKELPFAPDSFDRVLVDAPCTGTGTLRRNPEIRWRISASDITQLAVRQQDILFNAARVVRRGGRLVYSTCSVEREENEHVIAAFLDAHATFTQVQPAVLKAFLTPSGSARLWPHKEATDGFFIAAFEHRS